MTLKKLMNHVHIDEIPEGMDQVFAQAMNEYASRGPAMINPIWLYEMNSQYKMYNHEKTWEAIISAAIDIRERPELLQYIYLLKHICQNKELADRVFAQLALDVNREKSLAWDFAPLFALLPFVPGLVAEMKKRKVPDDIIMGTLNEFEGKEADFQMRHGRPGMSMYAGWLRRFIDGEIIRINRFNIEMKKEFSGAINVYKNRHGAYRILMNHAVVHRSGLLLGAAGCDGEAGSYETEISVSADAITGNPVGKNGLVVKKKVRLPKSEWHCVLTKGDPVLSVHIPAQMSLTKDICETSYRRAREIFAAHYPEFAYKAFYCESWMIDPQLAALLGQETNITRFQNKYSPYPTKAQGKAVLDFVFQKPRDTRSEDLPEDTSLRRAIKKHYLEGKYIYELGGVFF
ncbi:MAG: acyltransferase domain-containing protein [Bacillota bacterium]|nr:acyltransferase domain-containing protein [Bacillota bacterium]